MNGLAETRSLNVESKCLRIKPHLSTSFVVMKVHQPSGIFFNLPGVHKLSGELDAVFDVRRATAPFPALLLVVVALFLPVAAAVAHVSLAACGRHGVGDPSGGDGVGECRLPAAWGEEGTSCDICSTGLEHQHICMHKLAKSIFRGK